jgi:protein TonB
MTTRHLLLSASLALVLSAPALVCATAETSDAARIFTLDEVEKRPEVVKVRPPQYPAALAGSGQSGLVAVSVLIDESGEIESIEVTKASAPAFGESALACVRQWKFAPATVAGRPVKVRMSLPVRFQPDVTTVAQN